MLILDSGSIDPGDRNAALDGTFNSSEVPQRVRYVSPPDYIRHRIELFELGPGAHLLRNTGTGVHIVRGPKEVRSGAPEQVAFSLQTRGIGQLDTNGKQYIKNPGDLFMVDTARPYSYEQSDCSDHKVMLIDPALLTLPVDLIRSAAHSLAASPLYPLVQQHFTTLCSDSQDLIPEVSARLGRATTQLVAALIASAADGDRRHEFLNETLLQRIMMYVDAHLPDPSLSAEQIAAAHNLSLRQFYRIWTSSGHGVPVAEWILQRRIDRARDQLTDLDPGKMTIAAIAHSNGFASASHFTRRFRQICGTTPREWRRISREGPPHIS